MRHALRSLLRSPGFTLIAVLTLAVGIGANTTLFSAVHAILLRPLPYPAQERLVSVRVMVQRDGWERRNFSVPEFRDYRAAATRSFEAFSAVASASFSLTGDGEAARVAGERVSHDYFSTLGVAPARGRAFLPAEDHAPDTGRVVVLSHELWHARYAADPAIIGRTIRLDEISYDVVGVMPPGFRGRDDSAELWVPMATISAATWNARGNRWHEAIARLRPGVTLEQARAELATIGARLAQAHPATHANYAADAVPLREEFFGDLRRPLLVLLGAVALVLAVTCVNVANLLLVRLATRRREIAIRVSLGATRLMLARLLLAESLVLCAAGGALGLLLAAWGIAGLARWAPVELPRFVSLELHGPAVVFTLAVVAGCTAEVGALPALLAARHDPHAALKAAGRSAHADAGSPRARARSSWRRRSRFPSRCSWRRRSSSAVSSTS